MFGVVGRRYPYRDMSSAHNASKVTITILGAEGLGLAARTGCPEALGTNLFEKAATNPPMPAMSKKRRADWPEKVSTNLTVAVKRLGLTIYQTKAKTHSRPDRQVHKAMYVSLLILSSRTAMAQRST